MHISAVFQAVPISDPQRDSSGFADLHPGDRLVGRVLRLEADGRALIDLGSFRAMAQTAVPVTVGQKLSLTVVRMGTPIELRMAVTAAPTATAAVPKMDWTVLMPSDVRHKTVETIDRLLAMPTVSHALAGKTFGSAGSRVGAGSNPIARAAQGVSSSPLVSGEPTTDQVRNALVQLKTLLAPGQPESPAGQLAQWVRTTVEDSGILFEIKLAEEIEKNGQSKTDSGTDAYQNVHRIVARDLKAQLLILKSFLGSGVEPVAPAVDKSGDIAHLRQTVAHLLSNVDQQQELVVRQAGKQDIFQVFSHVLPIQEQPQPLHLKVYYPKKSQDRHAGPQHRIALLLEMDRLGPVRIDLAMVEKQLRIAFFLSDTDTQAFFAEKAGAVADALAGFFESVRVETHVSREKITQFEQEDLSETPVGRIDLKA
ncbi:MAG: hypothetical protein VR64_21855 [Desulfatitalea sp. BRH_c12]|nr:MAG: hypothetical protein VR64_21855 [Desulfatitalea sp. BRH_c12]